MAHASIKSSNDRRRNWNQRGVVRERSTKFSSHRAAGYVAANHTRRKRWWRGLRLLDPFEELPKSVVVIVVFILFLRRLGRLGLLFAFVGGRW